MGRSENQEESDMDDEYELDGDAEPATATDVADGEEEEEDSDSSDETDTDFFSASLLAPEDAQWAAEEPSGERWRALGASWIPASKVLHPRMQASLSGTASGHRGASRQMGQIPYFRKGVS
jgi:hypothetical protein